MDFEKEYYLVPEELLSYLDWKHPNLAMYIRNECNLLSLTKIIENVRSNMRQEVSQGRNINKTRRYEVLKRQQWKCNLCGEKLKYSKKSLWEGEVADIDHIHPYSKKENYKHGEENINELGNLQALCPKCNRSKLNKLIN